MNYRKRCYQSFVSNHWAFYYSFSQAEFDLLYRGYRKKFNRFLPQDKEAQILDVACGAGHFLYYLQKEGYINAQGIDLSQEQLEIAKKMGVKNIKKADLFEYLPEHPEQYDMIIANHIIEHLKKEEVLNFLDLIHSGLKPGRKVLIATGNAGSLFGASAVFIEYTHEQGFTPHSLSQVLRICSFADVEVYGDGPVAYDLRSAIRLALWNLVKKLLKLYLIIERGTGRGLRKRQDILESCMFAVAKKK